MTMVDTLLRSDQRTQAVTTLGSNRARISDDDRGLCGRDAGITSMVALNTALRPH
jgi:hypothetical protein